MTADYFSLATGSFVQDWSDPNLFVNANWDGVASIVGYRTADANPGSGVDPRSILTDTGFTPGIVLNQSATSNTGGVLEVDVNTTNRVVGLQGSNAADYAALVIYLNAAGRQNLVFNALIKDLDAGADNAAQQVGVQYRIGGTGDWINIGYIADATVQNATPATALSIALPAAVNDQTQVQIRILTTNAASNDELIGVDDIVVTSEGLTVQDRPGSFSIADATVGEGNAGTTPISFTVTRGSDSNVAASVSYTVTLPGGAGGASASDFAAPVLNGTLAFGANEFSKTIVLNVAGDVVNEADESFTITLSAPTGGATLTDASATGTILNDDAPPAPGVPFVNEIHYDNAGTDAGEAIEIAAPAGTDLAGWSLVLYSVTTGADTALMYNTRVLSGIVPNLDDGYGTVTFTYPTNGIQNGPVDGLALVDPDGNVVQFLSYEGVITAANGPAAGLNSSDIGVAEEGSTPGGFSLQLTGAGASYEDFSWTGARANSFSAVNQGQDFIGANATGLIRVGDASVIEGDSGVQMLVFTVYRAGGLGQSAGVDYALNLTGGADIADFAPGQPLSGHIDFAPGVASVQISVAVAGDIVGEGNESFDLLLANPTGNIAIVDGAATGTILNDDPIPRTISEIQGEGHRSAYEGQPVLTTGIVTAVTASGFYLQDAIGDGNARTSDALFVFTDAAPAVALGDAVEVRGMVGEFRPGGDPDNLTTTQIGSPTVTVLTHGNDLPDAVLIGTGGLLPPTEAIDDDGMTSYDPATDGIDFYESLEGMRVTIDAPLVVSESNGFGETYVVASGGAGATGVSERGGITLSPGDYNPEKIQIDATPELFAGYNPAHTQGDRLSDVTGIVSYGFEHYEVLVTEAVTVTEDVTLGKETTALEGGRDYLTVASFNLENLDPTDPAAKFDLLARNIVYNLAAPDIIGVQEIQDADGAGAGTNYSGVVTAETLIAAIAAIGGPNYRYIEVAPTANNTTGGEPNGNIRNGFFYNADRVSYVEGSAELVPGSAFSGSRSPLAADFGFNGETVTLISVHATSRLGSQPLWGANQPANDAGAATRLAQAEAIKAYVNNALATDASLNFGVLGDFNGFYFEDALQTLGENGVFTNLHTLLPEEERYTYLFDGNLQAIDHILVTGGLLPGASFDAVHINAEQPSATFRATDHDPVVARLYIEAPNAAPTDLVLDDNAIAENAPAGSLVGTLSADDLDPEDALSYSLTNDAGGLFAVNATTGALTATQPLNFEQQASYTIVARVTDPDGLFTERTLTIAVTDLNEAPTAANDAVAVNEDATTGNLWSLLLGNDGDPDAGASLSIASVDTTGTLGSLVFDAATQSLRYVADHDSFDALAPGATAVDTFRYTVTDQSGLTSTATVSVTVTGIADGVSVGGGNGKDNITGTAGEDNLSGGNGEDVLRGLGGHDLLSGGNGSDALYGGDGNDRLAGGNGEDLLSGGTGRDAFLFGRGGGKDTIVDFDVLLDRIELADGATLARSSVGDINGDGVLDLTLAFSQGAGSAVLLGVSDVGAVTILSSPQAEAWHPLI